MRIASMLVVLSLAASADEPQWQEKEFDCKEPKGCAQTSCCQYGLAVYTREKPGAEVKEEHPRRVVCHPSSARL